MLRIYPNKVWIPLFCIFLPVASILAQENPIAANLPDNPPVETSEPEPAKGLLISGFVDAYYQNSFTNTVFPTSFTPNDKSFSLGMANLVLAKEGKVGFVADIAFGPRAESANGYAGTALSFIKQLYVSYAATDFLKFTLGNFSTHFGYEAIDSKTNFNYSISYMFTNGPFFHTGLKANLTLSDRFGAMIGIFNDTDTKIDVVSGKHLGAQFSYTDGKISAYLNYISGRVADASENTLETFAHQIDLAATFQASERLAFGLNTTLKNIKPENENTTSWRGIALYSKYALTKVFSLGMRSELFRDKDGVIMGQQDDTIAALTISGNIFLGNLTLIPEFRIDTASKPDIYTNLNGDSLNSISGALLAVVYSF